MSNLLKIGKNGNFYVDGNLVTTHEIDNVNDYLMQLLGFYTSIEKDVTVNEIVHGVFGMQKFINAYFSEEYEVVRAFANSAKLDKKYKAIRLYKSFKVESDEFMSENEFLYVLPEIDFIEASEGEPGFNTLGELPLIVDENIHLTHNDTELKLKSKFTLLDILSCVFDEMSYCLKSGNIISA